MTIEIDHSDSQKIIKAISDLQDTFKKLSTDKKASKATLKFYSSKTEEHLFDVIFDSPEEASGYMNKPSTWYTSKTTKSGNDFIKAYYEPNSKKDFESEFDRDSFPDTKNNLKAKLKIYDFDTGKFLGDHTFNSGIKASRFMNKTDPWYRATTVYSGLNYVSVYKREIAKGTKYYTGNERSKILSVKSVNPSHSRNKVNYKTTIFKHKHPNSINATVNIIDAKTFKLLDVKQFPSQGSASTYFNKNRRWYKDRLESNRNPNVDSVDVFKVGSNYYSTIGEAQRHLQPNTDKFEITE